MLLWLALAVMTAIVLAVVLRPLFAASDAGGAAADPAVAVYRDQLDEVERDRQRGLIGDREAEAARNEIARRLLANQAGNAGGVRRGFTASGRQRLASGIALLVPLTVALAYLSVGSPGHRGSTPAVTESRAPIERQRIDELVAKVEARLREHPEDGRGWDVLAPVYLRSGRYVDAVEAYTKAMALLGETAPRLSGLGEAAMLAANGIVTETARKAFEKVAQLQPDRVEPKFWLALAAEQDGKREEAAKAYEALLQLGDPQAPWRPMVQERLSIVRGDGSPAPAPLTTRPTDARGGSSVPKGPSQDDVAAAERMTPQQRQEMIDGMVAGLAERLARDGRDLDGWQRLIRAYVTLGRLSEARAALEKARRALKDEAKALDALGELARSLGLS